MNINSRCMNCLFESDAPGICPHCKHDKSGSPESELHLPPGTVLEGKYIIGQALGQGGFGITYLAWDDKLKIRVAIKEYMPLDLTYRVPGGRAVSVYKKSLAGDFNYGMEKYLEEARTLARFAGHPNIVWVRDFFEANGTAYIVMEYVEGFTIKEDLERRLTPLSFEEALDIFMPLLYALKEIHAAGVLHRDISPDNMVLDNRGRVVLIDFGSARQAMGEKSCSLSVIKKAGFSPQEQYHSRGAQGPWSDIYSVAASIYFTLTRTIPPESLDRLAEDTLVPPSALGAAVDPRVDQVLLKALSVKPGDRYQDVQGFQDALVAASASGREKPAAGKRGFNGKIFAVVAAIILVTAAVVYAAASLISGFGRPGEPPPPELAGALRGNTPGNIINGGIAAYQDGWTYFRSNDGGKIYRVSADGSSLEKVNEDDSWYINVIGDWIYYRAWNAGRKIYRVRADGSGRQKINDDSAWYLGVVDDWLYYRNQDDGDRPYRVRLDGSGRQRVSEQVTGWKNVAGDWIYYAGGDDGDGIYRVGINGGVEKVGSDRADWLNIAGDWVYYRNLDDAGRIYRVAGGGGRSEKVGSDQSAYLNVAGDWVYYANLSDGGRVYRVRTDGRRREKLNDESSAYLNLAGDWIYYRNWNEGGAIYRMRTDGSGRQAL